VYYWDALAHWRPYRKAWEPEKVLENIRQQPGKHFDPLLAEAFLLMMKEDLAK